MRKSNWFVFGLALIAAAILYVCYLLVGCHLDPPLLIAWLVILVGGAVVMTVLEDRRRSLLRRVYVAPPSGFNTSVGPIACSNPDELLERSRRMLSEIDYDASPQQAPDTFDPLFTVITDKFDADKGTWQGKVVGNEGDAENSFSGEDELKRIVTGYFSNGRSAVAAS